MHIPQREVTPESWVLSRRTLLATTFAAACGRGEQDRITDERVAATHNNFYELGPAKDVWRVAESLRIDPWSVEVTGLVNKPRRYSLDDLRRVPHEERIYRLRCVEAWSMVVPWTGFPLAKLIKDAEPAPAARFVRFVSVDDPALPGVRGRRNAPWPYVEGLTLAEAMHDLTFVATGIYGHALPRQHGAPVRIVVPWKYGYKSPKSVIRIELVAERPHTFWETLAPAEYPFQSNVDPAVPHPRWSQLTERRIGTWDVRVTLPYNGYGREGGGLYRG
jgi:sulfoxide reductase catalytic subunit YedY